MSKPVYYIAGPMAGTPDMGRERFNAAEKKMREEYRVSVLNPACLPLDLHKGSYMPICLAMVREADIVIMLDGWENSPGARLEHDYAVKCGKLILPEDVLKG